MFGLIGKSLSHSFSKPIHNAFGNKNYDLYNLENLDDFKTIENLQGFNVTIPYKKEIINFLDELDDISKKTMSVNTVVRKDNKYYGYNTDFYGFIELVKYYKLDFKNKNVIILGNGSVSDTIVYALNELNAKNIIRLCRTPKMVYDDYLINHTKYSDYDFIINTTPVGMYPHNDDEVLLSIELFKNLSAVVDLIYNPLRTNLLLSAEKNNVLAINGFYMLVMQAKKAHELFFDCEIPLNISNKVYKKQLKNLINLVFIGLPLSGKSKYAKLFASKFNKKLYDTDEEIENQINMTILEYFENHNEESFRSLESRIIKDIYQQHNCIISTGGGAIKKEENVTHLKQNGVLIFLNKDPYSIAKKNIVGRPLIKNSDDVIALAEERLPLYEKASDISIAINKDTVYHINEIKEKVDEYLNHKRSKS